LPNVIEASIDAFTAPAIQTITGAAERASHHAREGVRLSIDRINRMKLHCWAAPRTLDSASIEDGN
jgi:hypothetical protein